MIDLDQRLIADFRSLLDDLQYDAIQRTLRPNYFVWPFPAFEVMQSLITRLPERQRVSYAVLLLGQAAPQATLERLWGREQVAGLRALRLLEAAGSQQLRTDNYSVVSFLGRYFVVSLNPAYPGSRDPDAAIYIGPDSLTLASNLLHLPKAERGLDLGTGSGIQAILAADATQSVTAIEVNPQAAQAARFNAILNGVADRVQVVEGNLYAAAPPGRFDLIVSNPPFLPVPPGVAYALCGNGGEDGLQVLRPLLQGIPSRLSASGWALVYAEGVGDADGPFIRTWLEELARTEDMAISLVLTSRLSVQNALVLKAYALAKRDPQKGKQELIQWQRLYARLKASHIYNYLLRLQPGRGVFNQVMAFDPEREERGIAVEPGVVVKAKR